MRPLAAMATLNKVGPEHEEPQDPSGRMQFLRPGSGQAVGALVEKRQREGGGPLNGSPRGSQREREPLRIIPWR